MRTVFFIFSGFILLFSCRNEQDKNVNINSFQRQWIKPNLWISELNEFYNFPNWFDDSLILAHNIQKISLKEFYVYYADIDKLNLKDSVPDKWITYHFDSLGKVMSVKIEEFNNRLLFREKVINFQPETFDFTNSYSAFQSKTNLSNFLAPTGFKIVNEKQYLPSSKSENYTTYYDSVGGQYLYLVTNKDLTSPISIDTMLSPSPKDILIIPNLITPKKIYNVDNKILESNVLEFDYDNYGNLKKYHFRQKSSKTVSILRYNSKGFLIGFDKFIYSDNYLISKHQETIKINTFGQPLLIYEKTPQPKSKKVVVFVYE